MSANSEMLRTMLEIYQMQIDGGRYFLHEHPAGASSWRLPEVQQFILTNEVELITNHLCMFGLKVEGQGEVGLAKKPTTWMTNAPRLADALRSKCPGNHEHGLLIGGSRSRQAQTYSQTLCRKIVEGFRAQLVEVQSMSDAVGPSTGNGNIELASPGGRSGHEAVSGGDLMAGETCLMEDPLWLLRLRLAVARSIS